MRIAIYLQTLTIILMNLQAFRADPVAILQTCANIFVNKVQKNPQILDKLKIQDDEDLNDVFEQFLTSCQYKFNDFEFPPKPIKIRGVNIDVYNQDEEHGPNLMNLVVDLKDDF